mmetsp:Transcript_35796/g.65907  ORF Transcript_35796/g.65907 Transcript_35796/m.65907 type:complete len:90 (-) Transcript_35796:311-580(-)
MSRRCIQLSKKKMNASISSQQQPYNRDIKSRNHATFIHCLVTYLLPTSVHKFISYLCHALPSSASKKIRWQGNPLLCLVVSVAVAAVFA